MDTLDYTGPKVNEGSKGVLLGVGELFVGAYLSSRLIEITSYLIIILVLLIRPSGLFGKKIAVRV